MSQPNSKEQLGGFFFKNKKIVARWSLQVGKDVTLSTKYDGEFGRFGF